MTMTKSNKMKTLAVGAALSCLLGGGATAMLLPSIASAAVAKHGADDTLNHGRRGADDTLNHGRRGADDTLNHGKKGADDTLNHGKKGADDTLNHG